MEIEELSFTTENICSLWKLYEATQPQHHMPIEKSELNWLSFVKLEPWFTFLTNTLVHFSLKFLGRRCSFWRWLLKIRKDFCKHGWHAFVTSIPYSSFVIFCFEFQRTWNWFFFFQKKKFTLSVFSVFYFTKSIDFVTSGNNYTVEKQTESSQGGFCCIFPCY